MEKTISVIAFIIITATSWAQSSIWGDEYNKFPQPKTRTDKVHGILAYIGPTYIYEYNAKLDTLGTVGSGWDLTPNGYDVHAEEGFRVDSIVSYFGEIPCPEGRAGCAVYHMGWVDLIKSSTYYLDCCAEPIEKKNVIHFSPK